MKLLAVDEDLQVLKFIKTLLEPLGYEATTLSDNQKAMKLVEQEAFGSALLNARIPQGDWLLVARHMRASIPNANTPIVILTGSDDVGTMRGAIRAGFTFFVPKPIDGLRLTRLLIVMKSTNLKASRICVRLPVRTVVTCRAGQLEFEAVSRDISESGVLLEGAGEVKEGQEMELRFSLPDIPREVRARATVARVDSQGRVGAKFTTFEGHSLRAIRGYITGTFQN